LLDSRSVREKIGIEIKDGVVYSGLPAQELLKPLRRFVVDITNGLQTSRTLHTLQDQAFYVDSLGADAPELSKAGTPRPITEIGAGSEPRPKPPKRPSDPSARTCLIPKSTRLDVTDSKIAAIVGELKKLRLDPFPNAVSVLFRVFLELSTDHYMNENGLPTFVMDPNRGKIEKSLRSKTEEVIDHMVNAGAKKEDFDAIRRALGDRQSPLSIRLLQGYVHNRFVIPKSRDLRASWDEARPYFEGIWA
jgi:hypothetical protein